MKMLGFLKWQFQDCYKSVQFWALMIVILAVVAKLASCPDPWPLGIMITGIVISFVDAVVWTVKFQYYLYRTEQDRIARELSRK